MSVSIFFKPKSVITLLFAMFFIWDANLVLSLYGLELESGGQVIAQILGGVYLGAGIRFWLITTERDILSSSACLYALGEFIASGICFAAISEGILNNAGYILAVGYLLFGCGFLWVANKVNPKKVPINASI
ncbi:hypothetical protein KOI40_18150 [Aestuariicella sp. G3-2]|uniref:hypothetical protein n=1 Tax=Pseudomaricurvus albidus TaxID=2842452 RepID=UPI001C0D0695|nr:hypothetical protein [Aestuariicella albida]MBU3071753.1 hypothetical protein [Aestuariicella albida]